MVELDVVLDDCLEQVTAGAATVEECLSRYPAHADALRPLLRAAVRLEEAGASEPAPAFKARTRAELLAHARLHPQGSARREADAAAVAPPVWLSSLRRLVAGLGQRPAGALPLLALVLLLAVTGVAQAALPGEPLYGWKRASESVWRAVHPDPVAADLSLAERRVEEVIRVSGDPQAEAIAEEAYAASLRRLAGYEQRQQEARIVPALARQQERLAAAGVDLRPFREWFPASSPEAPPDPEPAATAAPSETPPPLETATPGPDAAPSATDPPLLATPLPEPTLDVTPLPPAVETALPQPTVTPLQLPAIEPTLVDDLP